MALIYKLCLIFGGIFVLLSILSGVEGAESGSDIEIDNGLDADLDADFDAHIDFDADADADADTNFETDVEFASKVSQSDGTLTSHRPSRRRLWLPFFSFRFWTFGSCFFGLTGLLLTSLQNLSNVSLSTLEIAGLSAGVGLACGTLIAGVMRILQRRKANSLVRPNDLLGMPGMVTLPFDSTHKGKVEVNVQGHAIEFIAFTDDPRKFSLGDRVFVVETKDNRVWVVSEELLKRRRGD